MLGKLYWDGGANRHYVEWEDGTKSDLLHAGDTLTIYEPVKGYWLKDRIEFDQRLRSWYFATCARWAQHVEDVSTSSLEALNG